jgi:hypothetical protein
MELSFVVPLGPLPLGPPPAEPVARCQVGRAGPGDVITIPSVTRGRPS